MRRLFHILLLATFALAAGAADLAIVQTTDLHGSIEEAGKPGVLRIVSGIERIRTKHGAENALWIDCGDLTQGTFHMTFDRGDSMIRALSAAGCDAWIPGNHDFDYGPDVLSRHIRTFAGAALAANLKLNGTRPPGWRLICRGGLRVAVIGIVPPYLEQWIPEHMLRGVETETPEAAIDRIMPEIMNARPDLIVLAIHLGEFASGRLHRDGGERFSMPSLASRFPQIDLILAGHSHQTCPGKAFSGGAWFVQAPPHGEGFAVVLCNIGGGETDFVSRTETAENEPESRLLQPIFADVRAKAAAARNRRVAVLPFSLGPMKGADDPCPLAELLAESMARATGASGAFSSTLCAFETLPGPIDEATLFQLVPYENEIILLSLTEERLNAIRAEQKRGEFPESRMVEFRNADAPSEKDGRRIYAFGSFAASGAGGRFPVLAEIARDPQSRRRATGIFVRDALRAHLKRAFPSESPDESAGESRTASEL